MAKSVLIIFSIYLLLFFSLTGASAENISKEAMKNPELRLKEIKVFGSQKSLDSTASTSSRLGLSVRETPASTHVTDNATMIRKGYLSAPEALQRMPGVLWGNHPAEPFNLSVRGFSSNQVHILRDGIWLGPANMTGRPSNTFNLDRIELLKGPASVLHGQGVVGGVVNMITKSPIQSSEYSGEILASYGRFNAYQGAAGVGGPLTDHLWFRMDFSQYGSDGYVDSADSRSLNGTASLLWEPTEQFQAKLHFDVLDDDIQNYWGTPLVTQAFAAQPLSGVVTTTDGRTLDERLRFTNFNVSDPIAESTQILTRADLTFQVTNEIKLRNTIYYFYADRTWANSESYEFDSATSLINRDRFFVGHDQNTVGNRFDVSLNHPIASMPNKALLGVDYRYFDFSRQSRFFGGVDSVNPFNPMSTSFSIPAGSFLNPTMIETVAVFFEDSLEVTDELRLLAGFRYDHIDLERDSRNLDGSFNATNAFNRTFEPFSWRVGAVYDICADWSAYAQWSTGADPVGANLFLVNGNQNFDLTDARQWEVGLKASFLEGRGQFTAAYFDIKRENILVPAAPGGVVQNVGSQTSLGIEVEGAFQLTSHLNLSANAAYTDAEFGVFGTNSGNTPPNVATWTANAWASYNHLAGLPLEVGAGVRYVGDRFGDNANVITLQDYTLTEIYGAYTWGPAVLTARITNLFDTDYASWLDTFYPAQILLGSPRSYQLSAHFKF